MARDTVGDTVSLQHAERDSFDGSATVPANDLIIEEIFTYEVLVACPPIRQSLRSTDVLDIRRMKTVDLVRWLDARAPPRRRVASNEDGGKPPVARPLPQHTPFWEAFKVEFKLFLCTKNRKYQKLRREIAAAAAESKSRSIKLLSLRNRL